MPVIVSEKFRIRISEADTRQQLTIPALVNLLQEIAWTHSVKRKVSVLELLEQGVSWILSRMRIEIYEFPKHSETVELHSWVQSFDRFFCFRDFEMQNAQGKVLLKVTSVWGILDINRRRITPIPEWIVNRMESYTDKTPLPPATGKVPSFEVADFQAEFPVRWHDIDNNEHINNTCYFQWLVETLPSHFLATHQLKTLDVIFRAEGSLQDSIVAKAANVPNEPNTFLHKVLNDKGKELAQAKTVWDAID